MQIDLLRKGSKRTFQSKQSAFSQKAPRMDAQVHVSYCSTLTDLDRSGMKGLDFWKKKPDTSTLATAEYGSHPEYSILPPPEPNLSPSEPKMPTLGHAELYASTQGIAMVECCLPMDGGCTCAWEALFDEDLDSRYRGGGAVRLALLSMRVEGVCNISQKNIAPVGVRKRRSNTHRWR